MHEIPVQKILLALPPAMLRRLDLFMDSPYWGVHPDARRLYGFLREGALSGGREDTNLLASAAGRMQIPAARMYHVSSYLLQHVEDFLAVEKWRRQPFDRELESIRHLRSLGLSALVQRKIRQMEKGLQNAFRKDGNSFRWGYEMEMERMYLAQQTGKGRSTPFGIGTLSERHELGFIIEKLRIGCLMVSQQAVVSGHIEEGLLGAVLQFLHGHKYLEIPAVAIYYHGYHALLLADDAIHFQRLKQLLQTVSDQFESSEWHDLYLMAINHCIRKINKGDAAYFADVFDLYRAGLKQGALMEDGILTRWTYNNITLTALHQKAYDWAYAFIRQYSAYLPVDHRESACNFNLARYYFEVGNYEQAMQLLLYREYDDHLQDLAAKVMLCKMYYLLDEWDALDNQLDSIQVYIRRKKILGYHRDIYRGFIRYMRKLMRVTQTGRQALRLEIEKDVRLNEREWFLRQLE